MSDKTEEKPFVCPVCEGTGRVKKGFYDPPSDTFKYHFEKQEMCRTCVGKGIVWK